MEHPIRGSIIVGVYEEVHPHYPSNNLLFGMFDGLPDHFCIIMYDPDDFHFDINKLVGMTYEQATQWVRTQKMKQRELKRLIMPEKDHE